MGNFKINLLMMSWLFAVYLQGHESQSIIQYYSAKQTIEENIQLCRTELEEYALAYPSVLKMFDETVSQWHQNYVENEETVNIPALLRAVSFAKHKHQGQSRKDFFATPYIIHPIGVTRLLWEIGGIRDECTLIAALLHDTLEDTHTTPQEIEILFGLHVRLIVEELTNNPSLSSEENKKRQVEKAPYLSKEAKLIKLADRLYNVRDLTIATPNWTITKLHLYVNWARKLLDALRGSHQKLEQALEDEIQKYDNLMI